MVVGWAVAVYQRTMVVGWAVPVYQRSLVVGWAGPVCQCPKVQLRRPTTHNQCQYPSPRLNRPTGSTTVAGERHLESGTRRLILPILGEAYGPAYPFWGRLHPGTNAG